jgi:hypothetical protein
MTDSINQATIVAISQAVAAAMAANQNQPTRANNTQFDFNAFNALVNPVAAGLKLALAENLLRDAIKGFEHYKNPLAPDLAGIGEDLIAFRIKYKASRVEQSTLGGKTVKQYEKDGSAVEAA